MTPGPEVDLIRSQFQRRASIFACNDYAVISSQSLSLGQDECGKRVSAWPNTVLKPADVGQLDYAHGVTTNSFLNTQTFISAWDMLMSSGTIWSHAWIVKVDPDAVLFPDRLRRHLAPHTGPPNFVLNCLYNNVARLFGAIEVFSIPAIAQYHTNPAACKNMDWHGWGEDSYMQKCMSVLNVPSVLDYSLVGDQRCRAVPCTDHATAAFHPFKDPGAYWACWAQSAR